MKPLFRWGFLPALLVGALMGCARSEQNPVPSEPPDVSGVVEAAREPQNAGLVQILVRGESGNWGRVWVTVGEDTEILSAESGDHRNIAHTDLREGQRIQVWLEGMRPSDPAQANGQVIVVTDW
ncbi:MAG: hypothetical protein AB2385_09575 [Symbiobacterium sp.]|uniref:hypothetical protein n=1 Tax=Symbiobacterium sp. TaxID=1971213 RepID=UPI003463C472